MAHLWGKSNEHGVPTLKAKTDFFKAKQTLNFN